MASEYGFVYVLSNPAMPGVYKIGMTTRSPMARAVELSKWTGVPADFRVEYYGEFPRPRDIEQEAHSCFDYQRVSFGREFFSEHLGAIVERIASMGPITSWESADAAHAVYRFVREHNEALDQLAVEVEAMREAKP